MAAGDMARRHLADGDLAYVTSRRGSQIVPGPRECDRCARARRFSRCTGARSSCPAARADGGGGHGVNALTSPAFDPVSKQPELKFAAIKVLRAELPGASSRSPSMPPMHCTRDALVASAAEEARVREPGAVRARADRDAVARGE
jgi:hypothetical protein